MKYVLRSRSLSAPMKKLNLTDYQDLAEFRYQIRRFLHFSENAVKSAGLERGQYQLMLAVKGMPTGVRPRVRELADQMQIRHHSAVELINRLEAGGFVRRKRAHDDRREVLLMLTPKGERILAELALHHHEELRTAAPALVAALRRLMHGHDGNGAHDDSLDTKAPGPKPANSASPHPASATPETKTGKHA
jgi:DNA-binding MarR family transcriptional regulator